MTTPQPSPDQPTDPEDSKIITLARSTLARTGSTQGACLRDTDGRTYAGTAIDLDHLNLSAIEVVVAMAVSSGALGVEAVAVAGARPSDQSLAVIGDLSGNDVVVWSADAAGVVHEKIELG